MNFRKILPIESVQATLALPGSKSYTHRALMAAALAAGDSVLTNALKAEDTELTAQALAQLGQILIGKGPPFESRGGAAAGSRSLPLR